MHDHEDDVKIYIPGSTASSEKKEEGASENEEVRLYPNA